MKIKRNTKKNWKKTYLENKYYYIYKMNDKHTTHTQWANEWDYGCFIVWIIFESDEYKF